MMHPGFYTFSYVCLGLMVVLCAATLILMIREDLRERQRESEREEEQ